jgi:hypothetical protein
MEFKYNEDVIVQQLMDYIIDTYDEHYATDNIQATEYIIDSGLGLGFTLGNVIKYTKRYGKKGGDLSSRKDLLKALHYGIMALYVHDLGVPTNPDDNLKFTMKLEPEDMR